jgi:hypothetical protein
VTGGSGVLLKQYIVAYSHGSPDADFHAEVFPLQAKHLDQGNEIGYALKIMILKV